jgi:hypothetical protein
MSTSVDRLRDTLNTASGQPLTLEYVSRIGLLSRQVVEEDNAKQRLSVLQLYCNWLLHPRIDQSAEADGILASIDDIIFVRQQVTTFSPQNVQSAMGFRTLRSQLGSLLQSHSLLDELVTNAARWKEFVSLFVRDLCTKPLTFSPPRRDRSFNTVLNGVLNAAGRIAEQYVSSAPFSDDQKYLSKYDTKHDFVLLIGITKVNDPSWTATMVIPLTI